MTDRGASARERNVASLDALTGVLRRGAGLVELEREIARSRRTREPLALAFVDVDRLKGINDARGHAASDRMLLEVATTLKARLRNYDLIFRLEGTSSSARSPVSIWLTPRPACRSSRRPCRMGRNTGR